LTWRDAPRSVEVERLPERDVARVAEVDRDRLVAGQVERRAAGSRRTRQGTARAHRRGSHRRARGPGARVTAGKRRVRLLPPRRHEPGHEHAGRARQRQEQRAIREAHRVAGRERGVEPELALRGVDEVFLAAREHAPAHACGIAAREHEAVRKRIERLGGRDHDHGLARAGIGRDPRGRAAGPAREGRDGGEGETERARRHHGDCASSR